jgi:hypothetical protein
MEFTDIKEMKNLIAGFAGKKMKFDEDGHGEFGGPRSIDKDSLFSLTKSMAFAGSHAQHDKYMSVEDGPVKPN